MLTGPFFRCMMVLYLHMLVCWSGPARVFVVVKLSLCINLMADGEKYRITGCPSFIIGGCVLKIMNSND